MTIQTVSERAFQAYCASRGYSVREIPRGGTPTPDFEVAIGQSRLLVEIKEFKPNDHDIAQAEEIRLHGTFGGVLDGSRLADAISKAASQLKDYGDEQTPTLVVLYDNIAVGGVKVYPTRCPYFDPTQIEWAMYGTHVVEFKVPPRGKPEYIQDRRGGNRKLTQDNRTWVSAVAILWERGEFAWFFHNYFAAVPLSRALLDDERDRHFHNPSDPLQTLAGWKELVRRA